MDTLGAGVREEEGTPLWLGLIARAGFSTRFALE